MPRLRDAQLVVEDWGNVASLPEGKTLVIGLGGTGKEILLRLRRLMVEQYGELRNRPNIQFLHMDTDQTEDAQHQYDRATQDDPLYHKIKFAPSEKVSLAVEGGVRRYIDHPDTYSHIHEWFITQGKIRNLNISEGAGQIRMASRLGFYVNYQNILNGLEHADRELENADIGDMRDLNFDPNQMRIYVIASLAGGTGSGTFLDMGFLLQTMFNADRIGILFLPSFFSEYPGDKRMKANGYAALKELNHYAYGNDFSGNWTMGQMGSPPVPPPPFNYTYLVEGKNEANESIISGGKEYSMYQMVSEIIFQDIYMGNFAGKKRAIRSNLINFIDNVYVHNHWQAVGGGQKILKGDSYTTRFSSFGFSAIYFPTHRLHQACGCRLAREILERWRRETIAEPRDPLFVQFLSRINFVQGEYTPRDGSDIIEGHDVEENMLFYNPDSDSGVRFKDYIRNKTMDIRKDIEAQANGDKAQTLRDHITHWNQLLASEDSENPDEWGGDIRIIEYNKINYLERLKQSIKSQADELSNNPQYGISYTLTLLSELKKILTLKNYDYIPYFEEWELYWDKKIRYHLDKLDALERDIEKHENNLLFRKADLKRDMEFLVPLSKQDGELSNYYESRIMKQVCKRGKEICIYINEKLLGKDSSSGEGILGQYHRLTGGLGGLIDKLKIKENYFTNVEQYATIKSLYLDSDLELWYNQWMGEPAQQSLNLNNMGDNLLTQIFEVNTVSEALYYIERNALDRIEDEVINACTGFFRQQGQQPSALDMLFDDRRCDPQTREKLIRNCYNRAKVWVKPTENVPQASFNISNGQKPYLIGIDINDLNFSRFDDIIRNNIQQADGTPLYIDIGQSNKGSIVFYNELGGFTAFYPSSVVAHAGGLREYYEKFYRNPNEVSSDNEEELHIDKNRFQFADIVPKTTGEARQYKSSIRTFVLAWLLGILDVEEYREDDGVTIVNSFSYEHGEVDPDNISLGNESAAIDKMYLDTRPIHETHRDILYHKVEAILEDIIDRRLLSVYLMLIDFYRYYIYPPKRIRLDDGGQYDEISPFHAALHTEFNRVYDELVGEEEERRRLQTALSELRGGRRPDRLTYTDYAEALNPYTRTAGKFEMATMGAAGRLQRNFVNALVIDHRKIRSEDWLKVEERLVEEEAVEKIGTKKTVIPKSEPKNPKRPCPNCGVKIPIQAVYCTNCEQMVSSNVICQHCGVKTPGDLNVCWSCGREPRQQERKIACEQCYLFEGSTSEFPCPKCGWSPDSDDDSKNQREFENPTTKETTENIASSMETAPIVEEAETSEEEDEVALEEDIDISFDAEGGEENAEDITNNKEVKDVIPCSACGQFNPPNIKSCQYCGVTL